MAALFLFQSLTWFFLEAPRSIVKAWGTVLSFNLQYFSIGALFQTLFSPWKGIQWQRTKRGLDIGDYFSVFFSNLMSRALGAMVRIMLIIIGIAVECLLFFAAIITLLLWFFMPALITASFFYGIILLI